MFPNMTPVKRFALMVVVVAATGACAPATVEPRLTPVQRPCNASVDYPTDTTVDFRGQQQEAGPRPISATQARYPIELRNRGVEGSAQATWVVDTTGAVVPGTAIINAETNKAFGDAVCTWLTNGTRFEPLVVRGRRVTVRIANYPIDFTLTR
jgi:hypothetical protein